MQKTSKNEFKVSSKKAEGKLLSGNDIQIFHNGKLIFDAYIMDSGLICIHKCNEILVAKEYADYKIYHSDVNEPKYNTDYHNITFKNTGV